MSNQETKEKEAPTRNKERTRGLILAAATEEFSEKGFAGARIEKIAERSGSNKRMLYYYFQNKEELFLAVMENTYKTIRDAESELRLLDLPPIEAIRCLITFTWDYYIGHPEFLNLLNTENLYHASHIKKSKNIGFYNSKLIGTLNEILIRARTKNSSARRRPPAALYLDCGAELFLPVEQRHAEHGLRARSEYPQGQGRTPAAHDRPSARLSDALLLIRGYPPGYCGKVSSIGSETCTPTLALLSSARMFSGGWRSVNSTSISEI